jgi:hypothetical protein
MIKSSEPPRYIAEFTIKNFDLDDFFLKLQPSLFKRKVEEIWSSGSPDLQIIQVESLLDRGGRVPIPPAKEG